MLQSIMPEFAPVLIQKEVAPQLGVTIRTLHNWARQGYGPRPRRIGNTLVYDASAVAAFKLGVR